MVLNDGFILSWPMSATASAQASKSPETKQPGIGRKCWRVLGIVLGKKKGLQPFLL